MNLNLLKIAKRRIGKAIDWRVNDRVSKVTSELCNESVSQARDFQSYFDAIETLSIRIHQIEMDVKEVVEHMNELATKMSDDMRDLHRYTDELGQRISQS